MRRSAKTITKTPCSLQTKAGLLPYTLSRSTRRRSLVISVDEKARVVVYAPQYVAMKDVEAFIDEKASWVCERIEEAQANLKIIGQIQFDHDQEFLFLGKKHKLKLSQSNTKRIKIDFDGYQWKVSVPGHLSLKERQKKIKDKLADWYRKQAEEILGGRIFHYSRNIGVEPKKIAIRTQKQIWGSCDFNTQTIHLNWQIILSPLKVVDYVVVHELCHLIVPNHSKRFWKKVEKALPDFREQKKWLKINAMDMVLP